MLTNMARAQQKAELDHMSKESPSYECQEGLLCAALFSYRA